MDRTMWPAVAPYVAHLHLTDAILTATVLSHPGGAPTLTTIRSYGVTISLDSDSIWRMKGHSDPLPPADASGIPRILMADKRPLAFMTSPPQHSE